MEIEENENNGKNSYYITIEQKLNSKELDELQKYILNEEIDCIDFIANQTIETWKKINEFIARKSTNISINNYNNEFSSLNFIENLPNIQRLCINAYELKDLSPISTINNLKELLFLSKFKSVKASIKSMGNLPNLELLKTYDFKDIEEISNFTTLKKVGLIGIKTDNLNFLKSLKNLEDIELKSSDKIIDYSGLYELSKLKNAFIVKNYKNGSAEFISHLKYLEKLSVLDFNSVKVFPSLENLSRLRDLSITNLKVLSDISGVAKAPNLETLSLFVGKEFKPQALNVQRR